MLLAAAIGEAVGAVLHRKKMAKHFIRTITDDDFTFARNDLSIAAETRLDGIYVLRTPVPKAELDTEATVISYKSLSTVERAFRSCKTVDIEVRPVYHWNENRVRAHVFLARKIGFIRGSAFNPGPAEPLSATRESHINTIGLSFCSAYAHEPPFMRRCSSSTDLHTDDWC
jgi:hypothetical protein